MRPKADIFSGKNLLEGDLSQALSSAGCDVYVHSKNIDSLTSDYVFVFWDFEGSFPKLEELARESKARAIYIAPYREDIKKTTLKTILIGELFGPNMTAFGGILPRALKEVVLRRKLSIPESDFDLELSFSPDTAKDLTRLMFSYGPTEPVSQLSSRVSFFRAIKEIEKVVPDTLFIQSQAKIKKDAKEFPRINPKFEDAEAIKKTLEWLLTNPPSEKEIIREAPRPATIRIQKIKRSEKFSSNYLILALALFVVLLCLPFVLLLSSVGLLKIGFDNVKAGKLSLAKNTLLAANVAAGASQKMFYLYSQAPILGGVFVQTERFSEISTRASKIGIDAINLGESLEDLAGNILGGKNYDLEAFSEKTFLAIDGLYKEASFLQSEIDSLPSIARKYSTQVNDFEKMRTFLLYGQVLAKKMPALLGSQKPMTYLILFQNNMELRPTGGFIGSFGLATFDKGTLSDMEFLDVYTADGQLKGHIEPPAPIKDYLGEANWYLRDSNWDPDFPTSAARAEWFLEKEIDRPVEGVISVDLEVAKSTLRETGPIALPDVSVTVDEKNLYEKVQYYVESNFFPGSQGKANILTSLGRSILERLKVAKASTLVNIAKNSIASLDARHIQIFLHEPESKNAIASLGWDGGVPTESFGLTEANVGVNKANYFIQRKIDIVSEVGSKNIRNTMTVAFKNTASVALGISGKYKNYVRLVMPSGSKTLKVEVAGIGGLRELDPEIVEVSGRVEAGVLIEVLPNETKTLTFKWDSPTSLDFSKRGELNFHLRKQAGTGDDPVTTRIIMPRGVDFSGNTYYNTILARDLVSRISW